MAFADFLAFVWRPEVDGQGPHRTPGDPGGLTSWGVTEATWMAAKRHGIAVGDLGLAAKSQLEGVLRVMFWNTIQGDHLPRGLGIVVANMAMLAGPGPAARGLQMVVHSTVDGVIGPKTLAATAGLRASAGEAKLVVECTDQYSEYLAGRGDAPAFLSGWLTRLDDCEAYAIELGGDTPVFGG